MYFLLSQNIQRIKAKVQIKKFLRIFRPTYYSILLLFSLFKAQIVQIRANFRAISQSKRAPIIMLMLREIGEQLGLLSSQLGNL